MYFWRNHYCEMPISKIFSLVIRLKKLDMYNDILLNLTILVLRVFNFLIVISQNSLDKWTSKLSENMSDDGLLMHLPYLQLACEVIYVLRCGTEAIVAFWEKESSLLIVGRHGTMEKYGYDGLIHLVPEIDGVRVLSTYQHELIQKVPDVVQRIFRINSTDPGSFLLEASKQYQV